MITVDVVDARPDAQTVVAVRLPASSCVADAVAASGLAQKSLTAPVGSYGRLRAENEPVSEGDRIELYRPLLATPAEQRRRRVTARR